MSIRRPEKLWGISKKVFVINCWQMESVFEKKAERALFNKAIIIKPVITAKKISKLKPRLIFLPIPVVIITFHQVF